MKNVLTLIFLFVSIICFSQPIVKKVHLRICDCIENKLKEYNIQTLPDVNEIMQKDFRECYNSKILNEMDSLKLFYGLNLEEQVFQKLKDVQDEYLMQCAVLIQLFNNTYGQNNEKSYINESDCSKFKTGKFQLIDVAKNSTIIRNEKSETYLNDEGIIQSANEIFWENDCNYFFIFDQDDPDGFYKSGDTIKIELVKIQNDTLEYELDFKGLKYNQKVIEIE